MLRPRTAPATSEITNLKFSITAFAKTLVLLLSLMSSSVGKGKVVMNPLDRSCASHIASNGWPTSFPPVMFLARTTWTPSDVFGSAAMSNRKRPTFA